jgi:hypothetical protein
MTEQIPDNRREALRAAALKLMRYANTLTPAKLDELLDPIVAAALDAWIAENIVTELAAIK